MVTAPDGDRAGARGTDPGERSAEDDPGQPAEEAAVEPSSRSRRKQQAKAERARLKAERKAERRAGIQHEHPPEKSASSELGEQLGGLARAVHPRQALLTGLVLGGAAYVAGQSAAQAALAGAAVLVVQAVLGLVNDAGDAEPDELAGRPRKPVAEGHLPASNARFVAACLVVIAIPLSLSNGYAAALYLLAYLVLGLFSRTRLRRGVLSWLPWASSFATLPAFVSHVGPGLGLHGGPPTWQITAAAAAVGIGVHFLLALPDLVADNKTGTRHLPLRIALKLGATGLLVLSVLFTAASIVAVAYAAATVGLLQ